MVFGHPAKKGAWKLYDEKSTTNDSLLEEKLEFWSGMLEAKVEGLLDLYDLGYDVKPKGNWFIVETDIVAFWIVDASMQVNFGVPRDI